MFKTIERYPNYEIDEFGNIFNKRNDRCLCEEITRAGYARVDLCMGGERCKEYVHRLVYETFGENVEPGEPVYGRILHKDGDNLNNFIENLVLKTPKNA